MRYFGFRQVEQVCQSEIEALLQINQHGLRFQMRMSIVCLLCSFAPAAWASNLKVGPYMGHQNLKGHMKGATISGDQVVTNPTTGKDSVSPNSQVNYHDSSTTFENSNVQGLRLTYDLGLVTLRSDLAFSRYYLDTVTSHDKTSLSLGAQYNFFSLADFKFYGLAGLSFSKNQTKYQDSTPDDSYKNDPYTLLNYDLGLGSSLALTDSLSLVVDYKYSDALTKGEAKFKSHDAAIINSQPYSLNSDSTLKNVSETTQELTLGIMFSL